MGVGVIRVNASKGTHGEHKRLEENTAFGRISNAEMDMKDWADKIDQLEDKLNGNKFNFLIFRRLAKAKKEFVAARQRLEKAKKDAQGSSHAATANTSNTEGKGIEDVPSSSLDTPQRRSKQLIGR